MNQPVLRTRIFTTLEIINKLAAARILSETFVSFVDQCFFRV
jgi:hypothetical protein